jgi:type III secretory pathway component EscS
MVYSTLFYYFVMNYTNTVVLAVFVALVAGLIIAIPEIEQQELALADKEVRQMGICMVGAGGPCNGDSNWDRTH